VGFLLIAFGVLLGSAGALCLVRPSLWRSFEYRLNELNRRSFPEFARDADDTGSFERLRRRTSPFVFGVAFVWFGYAFISAGLSRI